MSDPKSSSLAIISLVLGIVSLVLCGPLLGIPAIILGIIALNKVNRGDAEGKGMAIAGIVTGSVSFLTFLFIGAILAGMLLPALNSAREKARRISCMSNIKAIGSSLQMYANDNKGYFPPYDGAAGLELLRKNNYLTDSNIYVCPSTTADPAEPGQPLTEQNVSYIYKGGHMESAQSDTPLLWDKPGNHYKFRNILMVNGHIEGIVVPEKK